MLLILFLVLVLVLRLTVEDVVEAVAGAVVVRVSYNAASAVSAATDIIVVVIGACADADGSHRYDDC